MASEDEIFKHWDKQGKHDFLIKCKKQCKTNDSSPVFSDKGPVSGISQSIYSLIWSGIKGLVKKDAVVSTLSEISTYHKDMLSIMLDIINIIDSETTALETSNDYRTSLGYIVKASEKIFTDKLLKERLEIDTLQEFKILSNRNFYTKFIKVKTKLYYKQRKFNLFREESEGYAKLITELNQDMSVTSSPENSVEVIKSLIGCFNLDPNRVLDVILDAFEQRPEQVDFFIPLIHMYMPDPKILSEVLAFKFSFYKNEPVPQSLYKVVALMLQFGIIQLEHVYYWLTPDDSVITKEWEKEMADAKEYVRKLNVLSTKPEKEKEESEEVTEDDDDKYERNQKFRLCEALIEIGDWTSVQALCSRFPDFCIVDQPPIGRALCNLIHPLIEPLHRKTCSINLKVLRKTYPIQTSRLAPKPVEKFSDLNRSVFPMLSALGPSLQHDLVLLNKIVRILNAGLEQLNIDPNHPPPIGEDSLYYDSISLLDDVILPTLSFVDHNPYLCDQIWTLVKLFPYHVRYSLYSKWKNNTYQQHSQLLKRKGDTLKRIKFIMKRVTKETIKPMGRHIGKLTHSSPGFLFDYVLIQLQSFDNMIIPVVDALKYLTCMSYDVLGYCVVEQLVLAEKDRFKHDGTSISLWLQSLATFCGCVFKKYTIDLSGLLQYLANQLKMQKSSDLLILKELVHMMAGIESAEEMTDDQVEALSGGDLLKAEAGYFMQVRNTKRSSQRLKEGLANDDLAVALCLLMAQQRYCVIYRETDKSHLKLVGKLYDQCQDTLVQFGTFLSSVLSIEDYVTKLPSIHMLLSEYHIHMDVAFFLARPMFNHFINQKFDQLRKADPNGKKMSSAAKTAKYCEAVSEVMGGVAASVRPLHPPKVWEDISPQFLVTFWSLTMYDLSTPVHAYDREIAKLKQLQHTAATSKELAASKQKKEVERYIALIEKIQDEKKKQQEHVERVMARLKQEKDIWFLSRSAKSAKNETITQLLQLCLFPRSIFTTVDALYCAKFIHILHSLQTANFSTLLCYDRLFCDITYSLTSCTENEANRYGRFLCAMLETVMRWHSKKEIFDEECASYPGFVTKFRVSNQQSENNDHVGYENYRHVCHKWHYKITKAIVVCLESKDYVQIRNSLIILIKILPHFPVMGKLSQCIEKKIEKIREDEKNKREDLFVMATSYSHKLKARASFIMRESDFHIVNEKVKNAEIKQEGGGGGSQAPTVTSVSTTNITKQVNGDIKQEKEKVSSTVAEGKKEVSVSSKERRLNRTAAEAQSTSVRQSASDSASVNKLSPSPKPSTKEKSEKTREKEQIEKEKQQKKEERREEAKKRAEEKMEERSSTREPRDDKYREERYAEMPLSKDGELTTRGSYYGTAGSYYQDSQLSSVSNSSSGSMRHTPDLDRETKRRKTEASTASKKHEERKGSSSEVPTSTSDKADKKERKEKLKKSTRNAADEEKELKKERKLSRKRDRLEEASVLVAEQKRRKSEEKGSSKVSSSHQNGDHGESHLREKRQFQKEKSPYTRERERERSHDREGRDKHRRTGEPKRR